MKSGFSPSNMLRKELESSQLKELFPPCAHNKDDSKQINNYWGGRGVQKSAFSSQLGSLLQGLCGWYCATTQGLILFASVSRPFDILNGLNTKGILLDALHTPSYLHHLKPHNTYWYFLILFVTLTTLWYHLMLLDTLLFLWEIGHLLLFPNCLGYRLTYLLTYCH